MMTPLTIDAEIRTVGGKGAARSIRRAGRIPGIVYGDNKEPLAISLDPLTLAKDIHRSSFFAKVLQLNINGTIERVIPRDVQLEPVRDTPLHIDFQRVGANSRTHAVVPIRFINEDKCPGLKRGGVLTTLKHEIDLSCPAGNIPEAVIIDLQGLELGHSIHIHEISLPEGSKPMHNQGEQTLATIVAPTTEKQTASAEEEQKAESSSKGE